MFFQRLFGGPRGTIDALEHLVFFIAAPIGSGDTGYLKALMAPGDDTWGPRQRSTQSHWLDQTVSSGRSSKYQLCSLAHSAE